MRDLLEVAALLHHFDAAQLRALAAVRGDALERFLADGRLEPLVDSPGRYRVCAEERAVALARLRERHPADEVILHRRAFDHLLARLRGGARGHRVPADEDDCLYHLDRLFMLAGAEVDWRQLHAWVALVRAIDPVQPQHRQRLALFEGYAAIRIHQYERGEVLLAGLLASAPSDPDVTLKAIKGLADAAVYRAQHERARDLYERLRVAALACGDPVYEGLALLNLGLVQHELGDNDLALEHCERSLPLFRHAGDQRREAHALYHLALYSLYLGRWQGAQRHAAAAAALFEQVGMPGFLGFVSWLQGVSAHYLGDVAASEVAYLRALALAESSDSGQPSLAMDAHLHYGFLCHTLDRAAEAEAHYEHALALARQLDQRHRACLIRFRQGQLHRRHGRIDAAFDAYRGAIDGFESLRQATASEEVKIGLLGTVQQIYEAMVLLCLERDDPAEAFSYAERARQQVFLDALAKQGSDLVGAFAQPVATVDEVREVLPDGALLLAYFTIGVLPRGEYMLNSLPAEQAGLRAHLAHPPQTLIFAVDRRRLSVRHAPLDPNAIRPAAGARLPGRQLLHGRLPAHLHACLIAPVDDLLRDAATLYLVPHGPLHHVPFGALRSREGEFLLRPNGPAVALTPSATVLLRGGLLRPSIPVPAGSARALGFNDPDGARPLRFAEAEACHVADLLAGEAATGGAATGDRLFAVPAPSVLHFAGHASFDPGDPLGSGLHLTDGVVTARDLMGRLVLRDSLVVVSACTSGTSRVLAGDELLGLQRALILAGARSIVCTRWDADDLVALLLMDRFYRALLGGATPSVALRDAQVVVRTITREQLAATAECWREAAPALREVADDLAALTTTLPAGQPFTDPFHWANFMLVGQA